jgi:hypothetical protein
MPYTFTEMKCPVCRSPIVDNAPRPALEDHWYECGSEGRIHRIIVKRKHSEIFVFRNRNSLFYEHSISTNQTNFLTELNRRRRAYKLEPIDTIPDGLGLMKL